MKKDLNTYIDLFKNIKLGESTQIIDKDLIYRYVDENFSRFINSDVIGKKLKDIKSIFSDHLQNMKQVVDKMINSKATNLVYVIKVTDNIESRFIELKLNAIYDTFTSEFVGMIIVSHKIENNNAIIKLFAKSHMHKKNFIAITSENIVIKDKVFDDRSYEILTLLAMHKTYDEISEILSTVHKTKISKATLVTHARRYLHKHYEVTNSSDLIHQASLQGHLDFIPVSLHNALGLIVN